ncbi:glycosyltransferase family 4 protein [Blastococcus goldschmidtiae]|uniref:Glycosyltransferase family 4 protein n=1 Tax=Blastococcus goldschmidtiae TaxID=3075546 RepID=A0ABU2KB46_9ACTN|nr:glycosyltransferase family 4 protein [Blastococcus sp. DSM 46792]MDT0277383.1 glycosyltransferase family 4 protein [Blastococcus sp. DSM 46792]
MAKHHEVWVLTSAANRAAIDSELDRSPCSDLHVVYCDLPSWIGRRTQEQHMRWSVYYYPWQVLAYFVAKRLHLRVGFHLIHHVTLMKFWMPTFLCLLHVPLIWGPVGGGESAPPSYYRGLGVRGRLYEAARDGIRAAGARDPFVRLSARRSVLAYGATEETSARLLALGAPRVRTLPGICLPRGEIDELGSRPSAAEGPLRVISIARLLHWKGFQYGLAGFAAAGLPDAEYWIVGDGPERASLERLAARLGIARQVRFLGRLGRDETMGALGECHALVHPSLHDSGGSVCLEAMAAGRPVIYLDTGGPAALVGEDAGIRIAASGPADSVRGLAAAIRLLGTQPELRVRMGAAGRRHMATFDWDSRAEYFTQVYEEVLAQRPAEARAGITDRPRITDRPGDDRQAGRAASSRTGVADS